MTQAEVEAELQPIATRMKVLADENPTLPISEGLKQLSDSSIAMQKVSSKAPADTQAEAESLSTAAKGILADCAGITK